MSISIFFYKKSIDLSIRILYNMVCECKPFTYQPRIFSQRLNIKTKKGRS